MMQKEIGEIKEIPEGKMTCHLGTKIIDGNEHNWYWSEDTKEIREYVGFGQVVIGYANSENEAIDFLFATQK